ncbi:[acyl-carrier-protein] S-malonyltransferase [Neglecta sp. X4]|uniref:ACP S-malonyltransferase n=1 Tax=unclassified Neglectibacter TaxID=2632164 RepID=UPI001370046E|nr:MULTISPECIES: ACP S-malonyltransferase [unclassified Neglectibacter]NBI17268.1 [acyl-carrier-protein] S-malonyltransferase [Neglectibacter sp. 59]NBJ72880.1 [acyl-carrier-protein] S-malonyltransferase [Neglectibacter sp. X4]NCE80764.1 [acyl-carrier-protein] S-malonyltransferase [Neglectibacter sp. X58]
MGKIAFVFSGQGAQYPGMGESLCGISPAAKEVFALADSLRPGTSAQCFSGTAEELAVTKNTQPCVYCVDLAAAKALEEAGIRPDFAAGFSLGEVAALTFGGVFTPEAGFDFVCRRAQAMQQAAEDNPGAMAAVLKLSNEKVEALCGEFSRVWPVNYNCPGQLVVAGVPEQLAAFQAKVKEAGGRAAPLAVSGGFHSPLMESAAGKLLEALGEIPLGKPSLPIYANATAQPYEGDMGALLVRQVKSPVRWQETIEALAAEGVDTFFECGPGKTLCGLVKKTVKTAKTYQVQDAETLQAALEASRA